MDAEAEWAQALAFADSLEPALRRAVLKVLTDAQAAVDVAHLHPVAEDGEHAVRELLRDEHDRQGHGSPPATQAQLHGGPQGAPRLAGCLARIVRDGPAPTAQGTALACRGKTVRPT